MNSLVEAFVRRKAISGFSARNLPCGRVNILIILPLLSLLTTGNLPAQDSGRLRVVTTTTLIADVARNIGGDRVDVTALVPPNSDVHAFTATPEDAVLLTEADVMLVNGAGLEGFLIGLVENVTTVELTVVSQGIEMQPFGFVADAVPDNEDEHDTLGRLGFEIDCLLDQAGEREDEHDHGHGVCDPHVWTNPHNVMIWAENIAAAFSLADPANASMYQANAAVYIEQLESLDAEIVEILSSIPSDRRVLVTNHDFLGYFAAAYHFEIAATVLSSGSTLSEPDPAQLADVITLIQEEAIPVVFAEISASDRLAAMVASETGIQVVTTLYSSALSDSDGPAATYLDYLRYNATVIAEALAA